jgi:4-aminobutyrate aminotransferase-like enzyme
MEDWTKEKVEEVPLIKVTPPGPKSLEFHSRASNYMKGYSGQVRLFPVSFKSGWGYSLTDVDGNIYIDFSSGIYVTGCGHSNPMISKEIQDMVGTLMNCHDFTTPIKTELLENLVQILPGDISGIQFYSDGTPSVEAGLRAARVATGGLEFISFWKDFHGKTLGSVSLASMSLDKGLRASGFYLAPRPDCYRCPFNMEYPSCDLYCADFLERVITEETTGRLAAIVMEPVQGWAGSIFPPPEFIPRVREICFERNILLFLDEILTGMGRTGTWFFCEQYDIVPDIITVGKGLGNGFPVTAMAVREKYKNILEKISASSSYGGNPVACAAALATIKVIKEERLLENTKLVEKVIMNKLKKMKAVHPIIGDVRGKGCLFGIELVKDKTTKEPFEEAGKLVYQRAFRKGLAWIPAGHILRMSPPLIIPPEIAKKGMDILDEAVYEVEREIGY